VTHYYPEQAASRVLRVSLAAATLSLSSAFAPPALADDGVGVYFGANVGYTLSTYRRADLDSAVVDAFSGAGYTAALSGSSLHNEHSPWSVNAGYQVTRYFGLEASYIELGTLKYAASGTATSIFASASTTVDLAIRSRGPALALVGVLPMTNDWDLEARLGAYEGKTLTESVVTVQPNTTSGFDSKTSTSLLVGVRAAYVIAAHWVLHLDYTHLNQLGERDFDKSFNVDLLTAGVTYAF
jgi:hypothetical protein